MAGMVHQKWPKPMAEKPTKKKCPEKEKESLTLAHDLRFFNVEGEAGMHAYSQASLTDHEDIADQLRAWELKEYNDQIRRETSGYKSWLASFASFCNDESLYRVVKYSTYSGNGVVPKKKSVKVNKIQACFLITKEDKQKNFNSEFVDEFFRLDQDDSWGNHSYTASIYRDRMQRSERQREKNTRNNGKPIYLVNIIPKDWDSSMSSQRPVEGYEHRARPPTVVELLRPCTTKVSARKLAQASVPWSPTPVELGDLSNYGTPANDPVNNDPLVSDLLYGPFQNKGSSTRYKYSDFRRKVVGVEGSLLGEFDSPEETVKYLSWLKAPEVMRLALYQDRSNYVTASLEDTEKLDLLQAKYFNSKQCQFWQDYWTEDASDDTKYQLWLLDRAIFNNPRKLLKPLRLPKNLSIPERQLRIFQHNWISGKTPLSEIKAYKALVDTCLVAIKGIEIYRFKKEFGFVLVHDESVPPDWTREEKLEILRTEIRFRFFRNVISKNIDLDTLIPMTAMEYANISRTERTTIDDHVDDVLNSHVIINSSTLYDQVTKVLFVNSYRRVRDEANVHIAGYLELGDSFNTSSKTGSLILPNENSHFLDKVIDQVSQGTGVKSSDDLCPDTEASSYKASLSLYEAALQRVNGKVS